jgi:hypothetical protein
MRAQQTPTGANDYGVHRPQSGDRAGLICAYGVTQYSTPKGRTDTADRGPRVTGIHGRPLRCPRHAPRHCEIGPPQIRTAPLGARSNRHSRPTGEIATPQRLSGRADHPQTYLNEYQVTPKRKRERHRVIGVLC